MGYATPETFSHVWTLPVSLAQTELRRGKTMQIMQVTLKLGQALEMRALNLHLIKVLTPGVVPEYVNRAMGLASLGVYAGPMLTSSLALVVGSQVGATQFNPWSIRRFSSPGDYTVIISNNTRNVDLSICAMGALKLYV